ncbi:MAG: EamA family transporter [Sulfolobaceae archaeon]|nr:EamA family transporter [Sulfolobaceae archaeon]
MKLKKEFFNLIVASLLWGTIGIDVQYFAQHGANSFNVVFIRSLVAGTLGLLFSKNARKNVFKKDLIIVGLAVIAVFYEVYVFTIGVIGADLSAVFLYTAPIWVLIIGYFMDMESFNLKKVIAIILTLIGVYLISDTPSFTFISLGLGLASGITYALVIIFSKLLQNRGYDNITIISVTTIWSSVIALPIGLIYISSFNLASLESGIYLGVVASFVAYIFFYRGLKATEPTIATVTSALEPVFTILLAIPILHEFMDEKQLIGSILIILSIILVA